jgi:Putative metallopeptidase
MCPTQESAGQLPNVTSEGRFAVVSRKIKQEDVMKGFRIGSLIGAGLGLAAGFQVLTEAHAQSAAGTIADNDSIFVDGKTFTVTPGKAKSGSAAQIKTLGARELGPGALIFRSGDRLYIVDTPLLLSSPTPNGQGVYVGDQARPDRIRIEYDPPTDPKLQMLYERLKDYQVLETMQQILSPLRLPVDLMIKTKGCYELGAVAWYDTPNSMPTVTMCYELLQNIIKTTTAEEVRPGVTRHDAIVGQFLFWTLHETGHAVFDIFHVPLFGREEDAADQFAAYLMLHFGKDQARRWIEGAAYSAEEFGKDFGTVGNYASVHGLPQQRFYNLLCLAYGADPVMFADVTNEMIDKMASTGLLPKRRAGNCEYEFQTFDHAFKTEIWPHVDHQMAKTVMDTTWFPPPGKKVSRN